MADLKTDATAEDVNAALKAAADGPLKGILGFCEAPLVSIDFNHDPASSTVDAPSTKVLENRMVKIISWYDNEWGYSCRTIDLAAMIG